MSWEVIVIDNNSSDNTKQVVHAAGSLFSDVPLLYEFERNQGLSYARNHGIQKARGKTLLFTDDDVCPDSDWAKQILEAMQRLKCDACGGYIAPMWEAKPPKWLTQRLYGFLAVRVDETGPKEILDKDELPYGANMAFRRAVFDQVGLFDTTRGRTGNILASGEDGEMFKRILSAGLRVMYFPKARVKHRVEAFRMRRAYFRRWRFQNSRNIAHSCGVHGNRRFMGIPLYIFPQLLRAIARAGVAYIVLPADESFQREIVVWHFLGLMTGLFDNHKRSKA
jgi:glycosyltransferase involved in cell wall biosynthesis